MVYVTVGGDRTVRTVKKRHLEGFIIVVRRDRRGFIPLFRRTPVLVCEGIQGRESWCGRVEE